MRWTPAALKKVLPRRELALKPPKVPPIESVLEYVRADAQAISPALRATQDATRDAFDAGLAWLQVQGQGEAALESMAALYAGCPSSMGHLVDLWCTRFGAAYALRALCAGWAIAPRVIEGERVSLELPWGDPGNFGTRPHTIAPFALGPTPADRRVDWGSGYAWRQLKAHLAALPDDEWEGCVAVADTLRRDAAPLTQSWLALAFCERPEWGEELAATAASSRVGAFEVLCMVVRTPANIPWVRDGAYYRDLEPALYSMLAAMGPNAAPLLIEAARRASSTPNLKSMVAALSMIDTDASLRALLEFARSQPKLAAVPDALAAEYGAERIRALSAS
ncbi:MAG: hypothetical protein IPK80_30090 [Nannocystis sp.]|nr:hypothetical protein [Nannocystis sp.]